MNAIKLNFINKSNDPNNSDIIIFQKNTGIDFEDTAVAWKVINNCSVGWNHCFELSREINIGAVDSWNNPINSPISAEYGQQFRVYADAAGNHIEYAGQGSSTDKVLFRSDLPKGSINANIYKAGNLLARSTGISPAQTSAFRFKPTIWIGVSSQIQEGDIINSAIISEVDTELNLAGIASADVVMTGGGPGPNTTPFHFTLENIVYV